MLRGLSALLPPERLAALATTGHGDEIILADAHLPGDSLNDYVIRAEGMSHRLLKPQGG